MYKFVKCFFLTICIFSTFGFILHLYFIVNGNVYGKINLVSSSSLSILKYEETSNLSPIKTARKDKVFTLEKGTSKKTVTPKKEKESIASSFMIKSPQMNISLSIKSSDNLQENRKFLAVLATSWLPEEEKNSRSWKCGQSLGIVARNSTTSCLHQSITDRQIFRSMHQIRVEVVTDPQNKMPGYPCIKRHGDEYSGKISQ